MLCQIKNLMIAVSSKVILAMIPGARINKADRVVKQAQGAVIQETRDSKVEQVGAISKANRASKVNRKVGLIVIARDSKAICPDRDRQQGQQEKTSSNRQ